jgi:hypothetical protein
VNGSSLLISPKIINEVRVKHCRELHLIIMECLFLFLFLEELNLIIMESFCFCFLRRVASNNYGVSFSCYENDPIKKKEISWHRSQEQEHYQFIKRGKMSTRGIVASKQLYPSERWGWGSPLIQKKIYGVSACGCLCSLTTCSTVS